MQVSLTIANIEQPTWGDYAACGFKVKQAADVWKVAIDKNILALNDCAALLSADEKERANRYRNQNDRERFVISRGVLRILLGRYLDLAAADIVFEIGTNKKPFVKNGEVDLHYNTAHSGNYILIAVGSEPLGVDAEHILREFPYTDILEHSFSPHEIAYIQQSTEPLQTFYKLWTRKEALLKATGKGIDDDMKFIPCVDGAHVADGVLVGSAQSWLVNSFGIGGDYACSLTSARGEIAFWQYSWS